MIKTLIADHDTILREGLKEILAEIPDVTIVAEASYGSEMKGLLRSTPVDLVLMDLLLRDYSGLHTIKLINKLHPGLPILVLSNYSEELYGILALRAGASGYIPKNCQPSELKMAIKQVLQGIKAFSHVTLSKQSTKPPPQLGHATHELLSERELQVLLLIASGKGSRQIADELCIDLKTVSTYRQRILIKMQMRNTAELANYVIKRELTLW